jgi:hypothetical protein
MTTAVGTLVDGQYNPGDQLKVTFTPDGGTTQTLTPNHTIPMGGTNPGTDKNIYSTISF